MNEKRFDTKKFIQLLENNPELPVFVVCRNGSYGLAQPGKMHIGKYYKGIMGNYVYSESFLEISRVVITEYKYEDLRNAGYDKVKDLYKKLAWQDAIIIEPEESERISADKLFEKLMMDSIAERVDDDWGWKGH